MSLIKVVPVEYRARKEQRLGCPWCEALYYPINTPGSQVLSAGKIEINSSTSRLARRKGAAPRKTLTMLCPEIAEQTFRHMPTGGVTSPTASPVISTEPNWIG